jgi:hypothetical protein
MKVVTSQWVSNQKERLMPCALRGSRGAAGEESSTDRAFYLWLLGASPTHEAFRQGLRDLGYVEGQNIGAWSIEYSETQR